MNPVEFLKSFQDNLSQNEFADQLRISRSLLSMIYTGERDVTPFVLARLGELFPNRRQEIADLFFALESHNRDDIVTVQSEPTHAC